MTTVTPIGLVQKPCGEASMMPPPTLGVTVRVVFNMIDEGEIRPYRFGGVTRFKQADLELMLSRR